MTFPQVALFLERCLLRQSQLYLKVYVTQEMYTFSKSGMSEGKVIVSSYDVCISWNSFSEGKERNSIQVAIKSCLHARNELMTFPLISTHGGIMTKVLLSMREIRSLCSPLLRLQLKLI